MKMRDNGLNYAWFCGKNQPPSSQWKSVGHLKYFALFFVPSLLGTVRCYSQIDFHLHKNVLPVRRELKNAAIIVLAWGVEEGHTIGPCRHTPASQHSFKISNHAQ